MTIADQYWNGKEWTAYKWTKYEETVVARWDKVQTITVPAVSPATYELYATGYAFEPGMAVGVVMRDPVVGDAFVGYFPSFGDAGNHVADMIEFVRRKKEEVPQRKRNPFYKSEET